jgi:excisionase family DNA binding protein
MNLLTTTEAAAALSVTPDHIRLLIRKKMLKVDAKRGRDWLIPASEVEKYQKNRRSPGRPKEPR